MADSIVLHAERRERAGKGAARAARRAGLVPGVIYGSKREPSLVAVNPRELSLELRRPGFFTKLYNVEVKAAAEGKVEATERVLVRDVQIHPVNDQPLHVDFLRVDPNTKVSVEIPVVFENEGLSPGLKRGGVLNIVRHTIEVECFAEQIPAEIRIDLTGHDIGHSIHISAIKLPEGVRPTITGRDFTVATIAPPTVLAVEAEVAAAPVETEVITAKEKEAKEPAEGKEAKGKEAKAE